MNSILVGYDLNSPGQDYDGLVRELESYGTYWHHLDSTWLVRTVQTHVQVRDALLPFLDSTDELLVIDITDRPAAWHGLGCKAVEWLREQLW